MVNLLFKIEVGVESVFYFSIMWGASYFRMKFGDKKTHQFAYCLCNAAIAKLKAAKPTFKGHRTRLTNWIEFVPLSKSWKKYIIVQIMLLNELNALWKIIQICNNSCNQRNLYQWIQWTVGRYILLRTA